MGQYRQVGQIIPDEADFMRLDSDGLHHFTGSRKLIGEALAHPLDAEFLGSKFDDLGIPGR